MSQFPKQGRFPRTKPSDVPPPGAYDPKIHNPSDDPWRKGAIEINKAPRGKEGPAGPDVFGLYNPDGEPSGGTKPRKPLSHTTTNTANPAAEKQVARLTSQLTNTTTQLSTLRTTHSQTETQLRTATRSLQASESKAASLEKQVEKLEGKVAAVGELQKRFVGLGEEHDKSKGRWEKEASNLKAVNSQLEVQVGEGEQALYLARWEYAHLSVAGRENAQHLLARQRALLDEQLAEKHLNALLNLKLKTKLSTRQTQITELASLVGELEQSVEVRDSALSQALHDGDEGWKEAKRGWEVENELDEERKAWEEDRSSLLAEIATWLDTATLEASHREQLTESLASVEATLSETLDSLSTLSTTASTLRSDLATTTTQLSEQTCSQALTSDQLASTKSQLVTLQEETEALRQEQREEREKWEEEREVLRMEVKRREGELEKETERGKRLGRELGISKIAEGALQSEIAATTNTTTVLQNLQTLHSQVVQEKEALQNRLKAEEAYVGRLEEDHAELCGQGNPLQKVKVLERIRREGRVERENAAKLAAALSAALRERDALKTELQAYQTFNAPSIPNTHLPHPPTTTITTLQTSRVSRSASSSVSPEVKEGENQPVRQHSVGPSRLPLLRASRSKVVASSVGAGVEKLALEACAEESSGWEEGERSGAVRMEGRMTLGELLS